MNFYLFYKTLRLRHSDAHNAFFFEIINNFNPNFSLWKLFLKYFTLLKTLQVTDKLK